MKKKYIFWTVTGLVVVTGLSIGIPMLLSNKTGDGKKGDLDEGGKNTVKDKEIELVDTYVNIRSSPEVDNKNYCNRWGYGYDCVDNIITKWTTKKIGKVLASVKTDEYYWFKIAIAGDENNIGYVREDVVKIIK
tara:strand:+ start:1516 stop:1917 length:402 start_codon:yes stop_codon:yes gene_type:complete